MMAWVMGLPAIAHVWDELAILARPNNEGTFTLEKYSFLQPTTYTNAVFFDFDNDENLDLLIMGQGGDWNISGDIKFVTLYRNLGADEDFRFERVPDAGFLQRRDEGFYNPISTGDFNHDGYTDVLIMSNQNGRHIDLYLNDKGTGRFIRQEIDFEAATNGSVMFGDLNNDGWLDIEYSGYGDKTSTALKTYINQQNSPEHSKDNPPWQTSMETGHWTSSAPETGQPNLSLPSIIIRQTVPDIYLSATSRKQKAAFSA